MIPPPTSPAFRTPRPPAPIDSYDLPHPAVPSALDGLRILHLTDGHVTRPQAARDRFKRTLEALQRTPADLVLLTGDYMTKPGDEPHALDALARLADAWSARWGAFGVFGNHDSAAFKAAAHEIKGVQWLNNTTCDVPGLPLRILGASYPEDLLATQIAAAQADDTMTGPPNRRPLTLTLAHRPNELFPAAQLNLPLVFCGHTHGGQIRISSSLAPHTSTDMPADLASGIIRYRNTLCCISRGLGEAAIDIRINCPPQIPLYTLRHGAFPEPVAQRAGRKRKPNPSDRQPTTGPAAPRSTSLFQGPPPPPPDEPVRVVTW